MPTLAFIVSWTLLLSHIALAASYVVATVVWQDGQTGPTGLSDGGHLGFAGQMTTVTLCLWFWIVSSVRPAGRSTPLACVLLAATQAAVLALVAVHVCTYAAPFGRTGWAAWLPRAYLAGSGALLAAGVLCCLAYVGDARSGDRRRLDVRPNVASGVTWVFVGMVALFAAFELAYEVLETSGRVPGPPLALRGLRGHMAVIVFALSAVWLGKAKHLRPTATLSPRACLVLSCAAIGLLGLLVLGVATRGSRYVLDWVGMAALLPVLYWCGRAVWTGDGGRAASSAQV